MLNFHTSSTIYLSQSEGCDDWTGFCDKAQPQYGIGPVKTFDRAMELLGRMRASGSIQPVTVCIMGDHYLEKPVCVGSPQYARIEGMETVRCPSGGVTFESHPEKKARLIGGRRIEGLYESSFNGVRCLCAKLPQVEAGQWSFTDLVVNGRRAVPARYPKNGTLRAVTTEHPAIATENAPIHDTSGGSHWFVARKEDLQGISGIENATVSFYHWWIDEHCPVKSYDAATGRVELACRTRYRITAEYEQDYTGNLEYYLENIPLCMNEPGEWYLDHKEGVLYYIPQEGETAENTEIFAPVADKLFCIAGRPDAPVRGVRLRGLELLCTRGDYMSADENGELCGADVQSVHAAPGAVTFEYAENCAVEDCTMRGLGLHAVEILRGCSDIRVENCLMEQLGAGGVKVFGAAAEQLETSPREATHHITVRGCRILHCGRRHAAACGVLVCHAHSNEITENEIAFLDYTGISAGWVWGYGPNSTYGNLISGNHIHHIGMGRLSDMGGIYLLGQQPGTVVRANRIHDVTSNHYGGNGIYADQGAGGVLFERNLVYRCKTAAYTQHYGSYNVVRDNIFAFCGNCLVNNHHRDDALPALLLEHNILLTDGEQVYLPLVGGQRSSRNLVWDAAGGSPVMCRCPAELKLPEWQAVFGRDEGSLAADPGFADAKNGDFTLPENSPFYTL
ncbi:MAG: right-handed parallel beta-helix repeat-containing protein [Oscillospiraceae bacterium]|nr:right-handed parallel beta-helix repeat-containing protein [Oscillospiraceae bacterium]